MTGQCTETPAEPTGSALCKRAEHQRMEQAEDAQKFHRREYFGRI